MEGVVKINVHPLALFSIVDAYERRSNVTSRVLGTLIGYSDSQCIHVTNSYAVPHTENEAEVFMSIEFNKTMLGLNSKVNASERIVGWYSTGTEITAHSKLVHEDYYQKLCRKQCVMMLVDTSMKSLDMMIKAYMSRAIGVPTRLTGVMFVPLEVQIAPYESEALALNLMREGLSNRKRQVFMKNDMNQVIDDSGRVLDMLTVVLNYVTNVVNNKVQPDPRVGRKLAQIVLAIPKIDGDKLQELVEASTKDMLMYTYLCSLVKAELKITEKLLNSSN